jgi:hypothetical protein
VQNFIEWANSNGWQDRHQLVHRAHLTGVKIRTANSTLTGLLAITGDSTSLRFLFAENRVNERYGDVTTGKPSARTVASGTPHFPEQDFAGVRHSSSAEWAFYVKLT